MAPPPLNLPGKSIAKPTTNKILCPKCGKANHISIAAKTMGQVVCKRCGRIIKINK